MARPKKGTTFNDRLLQYSSVNLVTGCWEYHGYRNPDGYGKLHKDGKVVSAHRGKWEDLHGPISEEVEICHTCDNPPCWNPDHLFEGTHTDNIRDMIKKGRRKPTIGGQNPCAKLNEDKVAEIKKRLNAGETCASLGRIYGVSEVAIGFIKRGRKWTHVEASP